MNFLEFALLAAICAPNINITTLSAIVSHESRGNIYAINVNNNYRLLHQPKNYSEAIQIAQKLLQKGYNFDSGLGQINSKNYKKLRMTIADLFNPCYNLQATQYILTNCYKRASTQYKAEQMILQAALSCYNTGNFSKGFQNGYVQKVISNTGIKIPSLQPEVENKLKINQKKQTHHIKITSTAEKNIPDIFNKNMQDAFEKAISYPTKLNHF